MIFALLALGARFSWLQDTVESPSLSGSLRGVVTFAGTKAGASPMPGVQLALTSANARTPPLSTSTDEEGRYQFTGLADGVYALEATAEGFEPQGASVAIAQGASVVRDFTMRLATVVQTTVVRQQAGAIETQSANSRANVSSTQINDLPLAKQNTNAFLAIPVVPSVVQTPNGVLNIKGAAENQGMLLVNSAEAVDPVTGSFEIPVPVEAVQSVSVIETAYEAQYGGFTGGLTDISTKQPSERWEFGLDDFVPGFRGKNGHLVGIQDENSRVFITGPAVKKRLNFTEIGSFQFDRPPVRGLAWPYNETVKRGAGSMTILQAIFSERHLLNVSLNLFSHQTQFANINALVPQSASSDDRQHGFWLGANDSYQLGNGMLLNAVLRYTRLDSSAHGQGPAAMVITPDGWGGNFFDSWARTGERTQGLSILHFPTTKRHDLKIGADFISRSFRGIDQSHPVQLLDEAGRIREEIVFQGFGALHASDAEFSDFIQDHWSKSDHLALDLGARMISQSGGRKLALAPRVAIAYSPGSSQTTVIRSGAGLFYEHVPLLATDFTNNLTRIVSTFDASGNPAGPPVRYQNMYLQEISEGSFAPASDPLHTVARNLTWNVELERQILDSLQLRVSYLQSQTRDFPVVMPLALSSSSVGNALMGLASTGRSRYYGIQTTVRYKPNMRQELNISYLHSKARGDLNILSSVYVPFAQPVIHPDISGILPSDVPNRLVIWGIFTLPLQLILAPVADTHTGLPYSVVDTFQNYVGPPNTARYPTYFSLDLQVYRDIPTSSLPLLHAVKNRSFRFGIISFDVTNHENPNAVFNTLTSPYFGRFAGFSRRVDGFLFEVH